MLSFLDRALSLFPGNKYKLLTGLALSLLARSAPALPIPNADDAMLAVQYIGDALSLLGLVHWKIKDNLNVSR